MILVLCPKLKYNIAIRIVIVHPDKQTKLKNNTIFKAQSFTIALLNINFKLDVRGLLRYRDFKCILKSGCVV